MVVIHKHERERVSRDKPESITQKHIFLLKWADDKFYYEDISERIDEIHQDKYQIMHDIIADIFFAEYNGRDYAYTSSSSLAGHHSMGEDSGSLIFWQGQPAFVVDNPDLFLSIFEEF